MSQPGNEALAERQPLPRLYATTTDSSSTCSRHW